MELIYWTEEALNYKNEWVAFSADYQRVVGHGVTSEEAYDMADKAGEPHAYLLFIPERWPDAFIG